MSGQLEFKASTRWDCTKPSSSFFSMMQENSLTIKIPEFLGGGTTMPLRVHTIRVFVLAYRILWKVIQETDNNGSTLERGTGHGVGR